MKAVQDEATETLIEEAVEEDAGKVDDVVEDLVEEGKID